MPQSTHDRAAELHTLAAHAHSAAATAHGKGDHQTAHELSKQAHEKYVLTSLRLHFQFSEAYVVPMTGEILAPLERTCAKLAIIGGTFFVIGSGWKIVILGVL